ncbi:MAG: Phytanoyl-CoA dioxygenase [Myxococcales bacterium]|nr:Phytanoyl-CoA dioxygenase [Myxococcales bacterium]
MTTVSSTSRFGSHISSVTLDAAKRKAYERDGYVNIGTVLTRSGIELMQSEFKRVWEDGHKTYDPTVGPLQDHLQYMPHLAAPAAFLRWFYFNGPLVDVVDSLIGPNIKGVGSQLSNKQKRTALPVAWHQDNTYGELSPDNAISVIVPLVDIDEQNGCLWMIPGSHLEGLVPVPGKVTDEVKRTRGQFDLGVDDRRGVPLPMRAGEAVIFHALTLHKSMHNHTDEDRLCLFMRYADADAVEVYNDGRPRIGKLLRGTSRFREVVSAELTLD